MSFLSALAAADACAGNTSAGDASAAETAKTKSMNLSIEIHGTKNHSLHRALAKTMTFSVISYQGWANLINYII